jgi:hypothetical protein
MNERKGWLLVCLGALLLLLVCLGGSVTAFLWASAFMEGILN